VDLPDPLGPTIANVSPLLILKDKLLITVLSGELA